MTTTVHHRTKKNPSLSPKNIYLASCRTDFLKLVEQAHGLNVSRLLGDLDIDSAQCLIAVDVISVIQFDTKFMGVESREYVFENGTNNLRKVVKINLERFVQQMKEVAGQVCDGKRQRSTVEDDSLSSSSSNAFAELSKRKKINVGRKIKHRTESSRKDESFSSGFYDIPPPIFFKDLSSEKQLEHNMTTAIRIDHFLTQYCCIQTKDLTKTKVTLLHDFKVHEEQLYEMLMYLRNSFGVAMKENIDKNNLTASLVKMLSGFKPIGYNQT
ncbi:unnamed protein product [Rotaria magnacalcarata]|uniref:Uncharacterized protein n=2 Tax=Rotaria magnacalcarata TaxID=392030 RepID=A0A8S2NRK8_9BILA|nr:unnamed protein product [Rotaria magnacalcarata]CAF4347055.1 unnamed protein product [Rotaria magnacalcarata]